MLIKIHHRSGAFETFECGRVEAFPEKDGEGGRKRWLQFYESIVSPTPCMIVDLFGTNAPEVVYVEDAAGRQLSKYPRLLDQEAA